MRQFARPTPVSLLFWATITLLFLYERTYLIQKAGLPHFAACTLVRVGLLMLLCEVHLRVLWPRFWAAGAYWQYGGLLLLCIAAYLLLQATYDRHLFGYVIGDPARRGVRLGQQLPYNLLTTGWYLLLTALISRPTQRVDTPDITPDPPPTNTLLLKTGTQWVRVSRDSIQYAQGLKDYTVLHTDGGKHIVKGSIGKLIGQLPPDQFVRIHKSYVVAWPQVRAVSATDIRLSGQTLPLGRTYAAAILARWQRGTITT